MMAQDGQLSDEREKKERKCSQSTGGVKVTSRFARSLSSASIRRAEGRTKVEDASKRVWVIGVGKPTILQPGETMTPGNKSTGGGSVPCLVENF